MTDNEITKALECCVSSKHICPHNCPMLKNKECLESLRKNALDLINRQKARIEELTKIAEHQQSVIMDKSFEIKRLKSTNSQLSPNKTESECEDYKNISHGCCQTNQNINIAQIKAEAVTEFAEKAIGRVEKARQKYQRLCKEQGEEIEEAMNIHFNGMINLLKEMVGADK